MTTSTIRFANNSTQEFLDNAARRLLAFLPNQEVAVVIDNESVLGSAWRNGSTCDTEYVQECTSSFVHEPVVPNPNIVWINGSTYDQRFYRAISADECSAAEGQVYLNRSVFGEYAF